MKKILSAIFLFMCLFAFCGTSVQAEVLLNDDFADSVTNSLPLKAHVIGDGSVVMAQNNGEGNKELVLKNRWEETMVYYDASKVVTTQFVLEAKIKVADNNSEKKLLQISDGGEWVTLATRTTGGKLLDCTGADTGKTLSTGKYYTVSVAVNTSKNLCTLYLDGVALTSEKVYSTRFKAITKIAFSSAANSSAETAIYYDYIRLSNGLKLVDASTVASSKYCDIVKKNYHNTAFQVSEKPETVYNMDFDSYHTNDSLSGIDKTANPQNQIIVTENSTGNHYFRLGKEVQTNVLLWYYGGDLYPDAVIQADYKIGSSNTGNVDFLLRDVYDTGGAYYPIYIDKNGNFYYEKKKTWLFGTYYDQVKIGSVSCKEKWVNVAVALHFRTKKLDVYINGELAASDIEFKYPEMSHNLYHMRYRTIDAGANARLDIDNLWIYKAKQYYSPETLEGVGGQKLDEKEEWKYPIDSSAISPDMNAFEKVEETPLVNPTERLTDYSEAKELYSDAICFVQNSSNMWIKDGKYDSHYKVIREKDSLLASSVVLAALMNEKVQQSDDGRSINIGNMQASVGDKYITVDGKIIETKVPVKLVDDMLYLPVEEFAIHVMKKWYGFSTLGFSVIANNERDLHFEEDSNRAYLYTVDNSTHMMAYLLMQQPNATRLQEIFSKRNKKDRPYIATTVDRVAQIEKEMKDDSRLSEYSHTVWLVANGLLKSTYESKDEAGVQSSPVFSTREPWALYWAYRQSGDARYKDKAEELALQMANLSHWSSDFNFLQTSQAMISTSYFYDLFYNDFKDSTKTVLANAIINKGLIPAQSYYNGSTTGMHNDWCTRNTNWNNIPNNAAMIASMAILGEGYNDELCFETIERAFVSLGYFMHYYSYNGGGGEGIGYTNYTLSYLLPAIDSLENVFGTDFGISEYPGFWETGRYIANASTYNHTYTLNDDSAEGIIDHSASLWFAKKMNDKALAKRIMDFLEVNSTLKSSACVTVLRNYLPFDEETAGELPLDSLYSEAGVAFSKSNHSGTGVFLGVHSGYNNIAHGRYDFGSFEFDAFGIRFANETGYEGYEPSGYGSFVENWKYYTIRPEGHNVYVVNPGTRPGQNRYTKSDITIQEKKEKGVIYTVDMNQAYSGDVKEAKRGYMLTNDRNVFVLQDEIVPYENQYDDFHWFWHTYADIKIDNDSKTVTLTRDNKTVKLYFDCTEDIYLSSGALTPLDSSPNPDGQLQSSVHKTMKKITARFFGSGKPITLRVIAEPQGQSYDRGEIIPISDWTIPGGSTDDLYYAKASEITVDGEMIEGFNPDCYEYTVKYPLSKGIGTVSAKSENGIITVKQAEKDGETAVIKIESKEYKGNFKTYTVTFIGYDDTLTVTNTYVDCDFEDYTKLTGDKSDKNFFIYHNRGGYASFVTDNQRKSKVLKFNVLGANETGCTLDADSCIHMDQNINYSNEIIWNGAVLEFSFKLDKNARMAAVMFGVPFIETGRDGYFYGINGSEKIKLGKYSLNEWHNVKILFDRVDLYNGTSRVYVYVDGLKYMKTFDGQSSAEWLCSYINSKGFVPAEARFTFYGNQAERYNLYFDDVKLYTTKESPFGKIDLENDFNGTEILTEDYAVGKNSETGRNEIYVSEEALLSDIVGKLRSKNYDGFDFYRNGEVVASQNYSTTLAAGTTIYVTGDTKKMVVPYEITVGEKAYSAKWVLYRNGKKVEDISEIKSGDELCISADVENLSTVDKNNVMLLAVYDGEKLVALTKEDFVAFSQLETEQTMSETIKVPDGVEKLTVKAFLLDSIDTLYPLTDAYEIK